MKEFVLNLTYLLIFKISKFLNEFESFNTFVFISNSFELKVKFFQLERLLINLFLQIIKSIS